MLAETDDHLAAIRAVREVFGLSVAEAKMAWLEAVGATRRLSGHEEELAAAALRTVCQNCLSDGPIDRKTHILPSGIGYDITKSVEGPALSFVRGYCCIQCELGFIPEDMLAELGLMKVRPA